jgi:3-hydroxyacyl-[acyl-carrier-protein] dehydratase
VHAPFGRDVIESLIPHRPPFLLVDEILELDPGKRVVGRREIRADDWWFAGHFPERPVMPGVLTIEAIAQAGAVAVLADEANRGKIPFFAGIDDCRFKRVVEPGDVLTLECEFVRVRGPIAKGQGRARVGDDLAAEAMLTVFVGTGVGSTEPTSSGGAGVDGAEAG